MEQTLFRKGGATARSASKGSGEPRLDLLIIRKILPVLLSRKQSPGFKSRLPYDHFALACSIGQMAGINSGEVSRRRERRYGNPAKKAGELH
jgi:hypothetical protein